MNDNGEMNEHGKDELRKSMQKDIVRLQADNTAQAQEILELKARLNAYNADIYAIREFVDADWLFDLLQNALTKTPAQSLAKHNAAIKDEVIERCADICADRSHPATDFAESQIRKYKEQDQ